MARGRKKKKRTGRRSKQPRKPGELTPPSAEEQEAWRRLKARFEQTFPGFIETHTKGPCSYCMERILEAWDQSRATKCRFRPRGTLDGDYLPIFDCVVRNQSGRYVYRLTPQD